MKTSAEVKQLVSDIFEETNVVGEKVDAQTAEINRLSAIVAAGGTVTQADLDAIADGLTPISERLKSIGADPAAPIPDPV